MGAAWRPGGFGAKKPVESPQPCIPEVALNIGSVNLFEKKMQEQKEQKEREAEERKKKTESIKKVGEEKKEPSAAAEGEGDFKNSLAALLSRGRPGAKKKPEKKEEV